MSSIPNHIPPESEDESRTAEMDGAELLPPDHLPLDPAQINLGTELPPVAEPAYYGTGQPVPTQLSEPHASEPSEPLFAWYNRPPVLPPARIPNFGDIGLIALLLGFGWICSGTLLALALHFHWGGISTVKQALGDIRYTLGSQAAWYLFSLGGGLLLFPALWHKDFLTGLQGRCTLAIRMRWRLVSAAL